MPSGEFCGIHCFTAPDWEDVDIIVPASHHEQREMRFTARHPEGVERTISLMVPLEPSVENGALALVERHGYAVVPGMPFVRLSKQHYTLTRPDDHTVWDHEVWKTRQRPGAPSMAPPVVVPPDVEQSGNGYWFRAIIIPIFALRCPMLAQSGQHSSLL